MTNKKLNQAIEIFSIITTSFFALYNAITGIKYNTIWNLVIFIYYFLLLLLKIFLNLCLNKINDNDKKMMKLSYILSFALLLLLNISLIGPVILLVRNSKAIHADKISSIAIATYVFLRLTVSIISFKNKALKDNLLQKQLKMVNFTSSIVSLIVLQNTLINVNGSMEGGIYILSFISSFGLLLILLFITVLYFIINIKELGR